MPISEQNTQSRDPTVELTPRPRAPRGGLPTVVEHTPQPQRRWRLRVEVLALMLLMSAAGGIGWSWWHHHQMQLPPGIPYGNGGLEADAIAIDTKCAGRIARLFEG